MSGGVNSGSTPSLFDHSQDGKALAAGLGLGVTMFSFGSAFLWAGGTRTAAAIYGTTSASLGGISLIGDHSPSAVTNVVAGVLFSRIASPSSWLEQSIANAGSGMLGLLPSGNTNDNGLYTSYNAQSNLVGNGGISNNYQTTLIEQTVNFNYFDNANTANMGSLTQNDINSIANLKYKNN